MFKIITLQISLPALMITVVIMLQFNCKKENDKILNNIADIVIYDTIKPLNYFPVYPGSFWRYRIIEKDYRISVEGDDTTYTLVSQDTTFTEMTTESEYVLHTYVKNSYYDYGSDIQIIEYSDSVYVPFLNEEPIYEYEKIDFASKPPFGETTYMKYPFLSETVGFEFLDGWYDPRFYYSGTYNKVIDKTTDLYNDSVIIVYGHYDRELGPEYNQRRNEWKSYYKNIGLKLHYSFDERMGDTIYKKELIEYYINH